MAETSCSPNIHKAKQNYQNAVFNFVNDSPLVALLIGWLSSVRPDPWKKYKNPKLLGTIQSVGGCELTWFNNELFTVADDDPPTVRVYHATAAIDRPLDSPVRTLRLAGLSAATGPRPPAEPTRTIGRRLESCNGRLYLVGHDERDVITAHSVDPLTGRTTLALPPADLREIWPARPAAVWPPTAYWPEMAHIIADDLTVYERRARTGELTAFDATAAREALGAAAPHPTTTLACKLMERPMADSRAVVRDHVGCLLYVDADDGRVQLYAPLPRDDSGGSSDLRLVGDLGPLPEFRVNDDYIRMWLDESGGRLFVGNLDVGNVVRSILVYSVIKCYN